jgi:2'-5' RNA ligase
MPDGLPADSTRFAVYVCPPAQDPFYQLGSGLLGYDVRARRERPLPDFLRPEWQEEAGPYGFHLTLVEGFYTDAARLDAIEAETRACCACLSPGADLRLTGGRVEVWRGQVIVWRLDATPDLRVLQTLLSARLAPFVTHSPFDDEVREHPDRYATPHQRARLRVLRTPRGLDTWQPHFTLVQPFTGPEADAARLAGRLAPDLAPFAERAVGSVSLFVRPAGEARWQVRADIPLALE